MGDFENLFLRVDDAVATLTLQRPARLNAMTPALMGEIVQVCEGLRAARDIRVLVITGAGRAFCAGADLSDAERVSASSPAANGEVDARFNAAMRALRECPVPTLARVNGIAAGGGLGLALACDIVIAAKTAEFVATFGPRLGLVPDLGSTWNLLHKAGRARALGMALLGERISASQAQDWGLIWAAVEDASLDDAVAQTAGALARSCTEAMRRIRDTIDAAAHNSFSEQLDLEMAQQAVLIPRNLAEGASAFMDKREPEFGGRD